MTRSGHTMVGEQSTANGGRGVHPNELALQSLIDREQLKYPDVPPPPSYVRDFWLLLVHLAPMYCAETHCVLPLLNRELPRSGRRRVAIRRCRSLL